MTGHYREIKKCDKKTQTVIDKKTEIYIMCVAFMKIKK